MALLEHPVSAQLERADWQPSELRRVVARLADGRVVQVGTAPNRDTAVTLARNVIAELRRPTGEWPLVVERLAQPEAIVSIDVLHA